MFAVRLGASARLAQLRTPVNLHVRSIWGSGSGKGGGTGGSIREGGGKFGEMEAAHEEQYFRKLAAEQLKELKKHHDTEIEFHEKTIKEHQAAIERHKLQVEKMKKHD